MAAETVPPEPSYPEESKDWRELQSDVLRMVRRELGDRLRERVESIDVAQDVMHLVLRDRDRFDADRCHDFRNWVRGVVRNRICNLADFHGAQRRDLEREVPGTDLTRIPAEARQSPAEEERQLMACLSRLDETQQSLILMRDFERRAWKDIAQTLGKSSPDAARVAYARAVTALTRIFEPADS